MIYIHISEILNVHNTNLGNLSIEKKFVRLRIVPQPLTGGGDGKVGVTLISGIDFLKCRLCWKGLELIIQRDFFKTRFSRCMLYRHNAAIGTD